MKITWHGHSTFCLEFGNNKVLIDPFLKGNPVFDNAQFDAAIAGVTHIVLTHGHEDHVGDTVEISQITGAPVIGNFDLCAWLAKRGVEKTISGNTGGRIVADAFSVTFVQAHHSSAYLDEGGVSHCLGNPNGVVLHIEGEKTVYRMGDTDIFGDMVLINELHQPQIAMVPIGDKFTMGGEVAALACNRFFDFETILPCHFGTFDVLDQNADKLVAAMGDNKSRVKLIEVGGVIEV